MENLTDNSWLHIIENPVPFSKEEFDILWKNKPSKQHTIKMYGKDVKVPRTQVTYLHSYQFSGNILEPEDIVPNIVQRCLDWTKQHNRKYNWNGALVNFYKDGNQYIGRHSDDTRDLVDNSPIYSFSFGAERIFRIRRKYKNESKANRDIITKDGILIIMGGDFQKELTHEVPKTNKSVGPRINITIRAFK